MLASNEKETLYYGSSFFSRWARRTHPSTEVFKAFQFLRGWGGTDGGRWFFKQAVCLFFFKNGSILNTRPFRKCIFQCFYSQSNTMWNQMSKQKLGQCVPPKNSASLEPNFQTHNWLQHLEVQVSLKTNGAYVLEFSLFFGFFFKFKQILKKFDTSHFKAGSQNSGVIEFPYYNYGCNRPGLKARSSFQTISPK